MVVIKVIAKNSFQVSLIQDDDVIQTFSADRSDNAFDIGVLPWRARCRNNFLDSQCSNPPFHLLAINRIAIM